MSIAAHATNAAFLEDMTAYPGAVVQDMAQWLLTDNVPAQGRRPHGILGGSRAPETVWKPVVDWLATCSDWGSLQVYARGKECLGVPVTSRRTGTKALAHPFVWFLPAARDPPSTRFPSFVSMRNSESGPNDSGSWNHSTIKDITR